MGANIACPRCNATVTIPRRGFSAGTQIAGFELIRILGEGGMGEVYLAKQLSMNREIALKVLSPEFAARKGAVSRFLKEVHLAARLEHANIVTAHDAGEDDGLYFMAMNFVRGQSLAARLEQTGVLPEKTALQIARKLALALNYAWQHHKIIHRDIKPANILLDEDGVPKLADMGLSKSMEDEEALTVAGEVMGTPNYMSPEQIEGAHDVDYRSDIYSLGATLYHVLTGHMPFQGTSVMAVLRKQVKAELSDPRGFKPALSEHCVSLLQIMLAKRREDRQVDWPAVAADIDAVLHGRPPVTKLPAAGQSVLIRRGQVTLPSKKIFTGPASAATPRPKTSTTSAPKEANKTVLWIGVSIIILGIIIVTAWIAAHQYAEAERVRQVAAAQQAAQQQAQAAQAQQEKTRADLWQVAAGFAQAHPDNFDQAIGNFTEIQRQLGNTKYELLARNEIARLLAARTNAMTKAYAALAARARGLAELKDYTAAANIVARYQGPFAADLKVQRGVLEKKYRALAAEALAQLTQAERDQHERHQNALNTMAEAVMTGDLAKARQLCQTMVEGWRR
ncbi:MAG: serine/threonine-protein kinase [Kiritimatiellaeota bacterium]|nr:serine/threonine-protein kinase [Kiritimatiellota bacterium]